MFPTAVFTSAQADEIALVRDLTFREDACRVARPKAPSLPSWQRSMTPAAALKRPCG